LTVPHVDLHTDGPAVAKLIVGMWRLADWQLRSQDARRFIESCLDLGLSAFDHADLYGDYACEALFGEAVGGDAALRDRMFLISKCGICEISTRRPEHRLKHYDTSKRHILDSVDRSLANLRTDRLDLLLLHRPDPLMNPDEVAEAFSTLREAGKVLHFGVSNFTPSQFELLESKLPMPLVTHQIELSPLHIEPMTDGTLDHLMLRRTRPMAWSPLGRGTLFSSKHPQAALIRAALQNVAEALGATGIDQTAYAWLMAHPAGPMPVLGTGKIERLAAAAEAAHLRMDRQQWFEIYTACLGRPVP